MDKPHAFTLDSVEQLGRGLGVKFDTFTPKDLQIGMDVELEHGLRGPLSGAFNVTNDDPTMTAKIALAHLAERGDYYKLLPAVEGEGGIVLLWEDLIKYALLIVLVIIMIYFLWPTNLHNEDKKQTFIAPARMPYV